MDLLSRVDSTSFQGSPLKVFELPECPFLPECGKSPRYLSLPILTITASGYTFYLSPSYSYVKFHLHPDQVHTCSLTTTRHRRDEVAYWERWRCAKIQSKWLLLFIRSVCQESEQIQSSDDNDGNAACVADPQCGAYAFYGASLRAGYD